MKTSEVSILMTVMRNRFLNLIKIEIKSGMIHKRTYSVKVEDTETNERFFTETFKQGLKL